MPRELITVSVGQAGNQIGSRFWELAVREHAAANTDGTFDDSMGSFFRNVDSHGSPVGLLPPGAARGARGAAAAQPIESLRARAVLVDMEEGVVSGILRSPLGELFDSRQLLTDVSGAGNNWAHGFGFYGPEYREQLSDAFRAQAEASDSLQGFLLLHSLGGGTGSGVGSYILQMLEDEYQCSQRFAVSVFPDAASADVVTAPYNALLSLSRLAEHAECVFPVENEALLGICATLQGGRQGGRAAAGRGGGGGAARPGTGVDGGGKEGTYDAMNSVAANMLLNLTASVRFDGQLNLDLGEVAHNLVPYPRLHFLLPAMSPLAAPRDVGRFAPTAAGGAGRGADQAFLDVLLPSHQLVKLQPKQHTYLACGLVVRGTAAATDLPRSIDRMRRQMRLAPWNPDGFKTSICSRPPVGLPFSLLCLANNCGIANTFAGLHQQFQQLYRRRLYTHHYEQYIELAELDAAAETVAWLADSYSQLGDTSQPPDLARLRLHDGSSSSSSSGAFEQNSLWQEQRQEQRQEQQPRWGAAGLRSATAAPRAAAAMPAQQRRR